MSVQVYQSTDVGAPVWNGTVGAALATLAAVLSDDYATAGMAAVSSITSSAGVAVVATVTPHGFQGGQFARIAGCTQAPYNGKQPVTLIDSTHFSFPVTGSPASPATGATITAVRASLGWGKAFTGTNKAAFRPAVGNRMYMRVLDDGSHATETSKVAYMVGYESMTSVDAGTNPFPLLTGSINTTNGNFIHKSQTADAVARRWVVVGDDQLFYLLVEVNSAFPGHFVGHVFGDIVSFAAADSYATICSFNSGTVVTDVGNIPGASQAFGRFGGFFQTPTPATGAGNVGNSALARNVGGTVGAVNSAFVPDLASIGLGNSTQSQGGFGFTTSPIAYPDPVTGGVVVSNVRVYSTAGGIQMRGQLPGAYHPLQNHPFNHLDLVTGVSGLTGRTLMTSDISISNNGSGQIGSIMFDVTGPWR